MKKRIGILSIVLLLVATLTVTYAWYVFEVEMDTANIVIDSTEITFVRSENTDKELVPSGFAWFGNQTEEYIYIYEINSVLVPTKEWNVDLIIESVTAPGTKEIYQDHLLKHVESEEVDGKTFLTITLTLKTPDNQGDANKLRKSTASIKFNFNIVNKP